MIRTLPWTALPYNGLNLLSPRPPRDADANGVPYKRVDGRAYAGWRQPDASG